MKESKISMVSYGEYAMRWRESQIKQIIKRLFEKEEQPMIQIDSLIETLRAADIPEIAIRTILSEIVGQPSFRLRIKGQEGYIIYRNAFYLFQPIRLRDTHIPLALRIADTIVRKDEYDMSKMVFERTSVVETPAAASAKIVASAAASDATEDTGAAAPPTPAIQQKETKINTEYLFWNECIKWAITIKDGSSDTDIPPDVLKVLFKRYSGDEYKREFNYFVMISWMVESIKALPDSALYLKYLGELFLELVWDECFSSEEQKNILKQPRTEELVSVASEQIIQRGTREIFRYVNNSTGAIEYMCGEERCSEVIVRALKSDESDPMNKLQANRDTAGPVYGFLIPKVKDNRIVFKTNERPVNPGTPPEKGGECEIVSSIEGHKKSLRVIREMIIRLGYPPFLLVDSVLDEKDSRKPEEKKKKLDTAMAVYKDTLSVSKSRGLENAEAIATRAKEEFEKSPERIKIETKLKIDSRKFQNVIKACALKDIILRLIDKLEHDKAGKRYFYRPISAIKSNHRLK
jgi:hypothetical protein